MVYTRNSTASQLFKDATMSFIDVVFYTPREEQNGSSSPDTEHDGNAQQSSNKKPEENKPNT